MLWGDRLLLTDDCMIFEDKVNGFKAVVIFNDKKQDKFVGKLYHYNPESLLQKKEPSKLSEIKDL